MEAQIDLRGRGTVRRAVDVDSVVSECVAYRLEIVHRDGSGVKASFRAQAREATSDVLSNGRRLLDADARGRAAQPVGAARAALIDEHEVSGRSDFAEELIDGRDIHACSSARPAREVEQRTCCRLAARGYDGDAQGDAATAGPVRIL